MVLNAAVPNELSQTDREQEKCRTRLSGAFVSGMIRQQDYMAAALKSYSCWGYAGSYLVTTVPIQVYLQTWQHGRIEQRGGNTAALPRHYTRDRANTAVFSVAFCPYRARPRGRATSARPHVRNAPPTCTNMRAACASGLRPSAECVRLTYRGSGRPSRAIQGPKGFQGHCHTYVSSM